MEAKRSIDVEGVRWPDDGSCRYVSVPSVRECGCIPTGVSGETDGAVENALPNDDLDLNAEGPAENAARGAEDVRGVYSGGGSAISEVSTELDDTDGACWDDSETCEVMSNPTGRESDEEIYGAMCHVPW